MLDVGPIMCSPTKQTEREAVASLILKNQKGMVREQSSWVGWGVSRGVT